MHDLKDAHSCMKQKCLEARASQLLENVLDEAPSEDRHHGFADL